MIRLDEVLAVCFGKEHQMTIVVSGRHMEVTPALKSYADQKASKLEKYYDLIREIEVIFDAGKGQPGGQNGRLVRRAPQYIHRQAQ